MHEFDQLDELIARLEPADWQRNVPRPETRDPWTIKDTIVHIVYWKAHTLRAIRGVKRPPELRGLDVPRINHLMYERWRDRSIDDVIGWHREVHAEALHVLAEKPDEWFGRREHAPAWPGDLDGHSAAHRIKDIEAALKGG